MVTLSANDPERVTPIVWSLPAANGVDPDGTEGDLEDERHYRTTVTSRSTSPASSPSTQRPTTRFRRTRARTTPTMWWFRPPTAG